MDGHRVQPLQAKKELVEQEPRFLVQGANKGMSFVETKEHVHVPLQLGEPDVQAGHAREIRLPSRSCFKNTEG